MCSGFVCCVCLLFLYLETHFLSLLFSLLCLRCVYVLIAGVLNMYINGLPSLSLSRNMCKMKVWCGVKWCPNWASCVVLYGKEMGHANVAL